MFPDEKSGDQLLPGAATPRPSPAWKRYATLTAGSLGLLWIALRVWPSHFNEACHLPTLYFGASESATCPQAKVLRPSDQDAWSDLGNTILSNSEFKEKAINWIAGAVQVPTESFDGLPPVKEDPSAWEHFGPFHEYLLEAFPLVHTTLALKKVNTYGLLYTWKGSDDSLKPVLLLAHQDVVPVEKSTVHKWTHPPFSGYFDGEYVWGRGSSDDKSGLIAILSAVETLIAKGYSPTRSVVLSFGFDEEISGHQGASSLAQDLLETYGENAFAFLVDEGGGYSEQHGTTFATPGVAEKGYLDVRIDLDTPGGHSSVPPSHTGIGILSHILHHIEDGPYEARLQRGAVAYSGLQCQAAHAKDIPLTTKKLIQASEYSDAALLALQEVVVQNPLFKALIGTTQAIDLIGGGAKVNALPEQAWAVVNHRIETESSTDDVRQRETDRLKHLVSRYNLTYTAFGKSIVTEDVSSGSLTLADAFNNILEPAPRTPVTTEDAPWQLLGGTIRSVYNQVRGLEDDDEQGVYVSPGQNTGNTDTRYYWKHTPHIFRYNHNDANSGLSGVHTVNERLNIKSFLEQIFFFTTLILNADESRDI